MESLVQYFQGFVALAGVATLLAVIVNIGKALGWVKDGHAPTWAILLNLITFASFVLTRLFVPEIDIAGADATAAELANILSAVFAFVVQLGVSKGANAIVRGAPLVGYSHSQA